MPGALPDPRATLDLLASFPGRGACTDAERRAMLALHDELRERGHEAWVETIWVRPQWAASLALHALAGVGASLAATSWPLPALVAAVVALVSYALELTGRGGLLRLLLPRRATQVVLVDPPEPDRVSLLVCAAVDAPRQGLAFRAPLRRAGAAIQRLARGHAPSALVWVLLSLAAVAAASAAREAGAEGVALGVAQFVPTVALLAALTAALDAMLSPVSPGGGEAGAVAVALALHEELTERPPERLSAGLVLAGAGEAFPYATQAHFRRESPDASTTVVLEVGPCGGGEPVSSSHLGVLIALPVHPQLRIAAQAAELPAEVVRRPCAAVAAHRRGIPAIHVRCVEHGIVPRHRSAADTPESVDDRVTSRALQACVSLADALDAELDVVD